MIPDSAYPVRLPVEWRLVGAPGPHPEAEGITGRQVVIIIEKNFTKFEAIIAKITRAPQNLNRPLDDMNSLLWELMDGSRTFDEIVEIMVDVFHERIYPASERISNSIEKFLELNLAILSKQPLQKNSSISHNAGDYGEE